ncbi:MAG: DUF3011 domain-containing protein [Candidatus Binatia bacterium]
MSSSRSLFWSTLAVLSCLVVSAPAFGDQIIRCESDNYELNRCPVATDGEVRLVRQFSDATCRRGDTWGYDRRGVWVDEGCAGEFRVSSQSTWRDRRDWDDRRGQRDRWDWNDYWDNRVGRPGSYSGYGSRVVRCESDNYELNRCPVASGSDVRLVRQFSDADCRRGSTWGIDRRGIWVDEGCSGEFQVSRR